MNPAVAVLPLECVAAHRTIVLPSGKCRPDLGWHETGELEGYDFAALAARAEDQLQRVERLRLRAARLAFAQENSYGIPG